jgi:hypothetical protein
MVDSPSTDRSPEKLPVLYLDWDGVVNFFGSRTQHNKRSGLGHLRRGSAVGTILRNGAEEPHLYSLNWSAELLRKLAALPLEVVFLSTWRNRFPDLLRATQWDLDSYRILDWKDGPEGQEHSGKVPALLLDQVNDPRPFIWADDEAHSFLTDDHRALMSSVPHLLLAPDENIGLTGDDYRSMVSFLEGLGYGAQIKA